MKVIIQRVQTASVIVDNQTVSSINQGLLVLFGVHKDDEEKNIGGLLTKILGLRIFSDENGKMNLSLQDVKGELLIVSQFTLYGDCSKGRRPSFINSAGHEKAFSLYEKFIDLAKKEYGESLVQTGEFGADMKVSLINDGPVTFEISI